MPATITHAYFAEDLFNLLDKNTKNKIKENKKKLMMFSQSTDPLMFYIISPTNGKKIRNLQHIAHTEKTNDFFKNTITFIKDNKYYEKQDVLAFLYGFICHFVLDSNVHPFIFYKTGEFIKDDIKTYKYNGLHHNMESYLDNYMLKKHNITKINLKKFCFSLKPFTKELNKVISYSFLKTYNINNMDKIYLNSLKQMNFFVTAFRLDPHKYKSHIYRFIDKFTPPKTFKLEAISYNIVDKKIDYLNNNHKEWNYPINKKFKSHKSFEELYQDSLIEAKNIIEKVNNYFFKNQNLEIDSLFHNRNYLTGVDCKIKKKQKYFEF